MTGQVERVTTPGHEPAANVRLFCCEAMQPIYISYPESERAFAHRLVEDLQERGYTVFIDAVGNPGSPAWASETRRAIRSSGALIMILSPEEGRRTGTRHEGVLALRGNKPFIVLQQTPGDLPRYAQGAVVIDSAQPYNAVLRALFDELPSALSLLKAPTPVPRPQPRPPRQPRFARRRRRVLLAVLALLVLCVAVGISAGLIPV